MKNKIQNTILNYDFASLYPTQIGDFSKLFEKEKLRRERKEKLEKIKQISIENATLEHVY
jgi:hypothetical protein